MRNPLETIRRFRRLRALVLGDAMLDTYLEGRARRLCSEGPVPVVQRVGQDQSPGGAANAAANLRSLGAEVDLLSIIGPDSTGESLRQCLLESGIRDDGVVSDRHAVTVHKLRILADDQYVVRFDEGAANQWSAEAQLSLIGRLEELYQRSDLIVISDYGYGTLSDPLLDRLHELRRAHPRPLFIDSKDLRRFRDAGATLITPNHLEAFVAVERRMPGDGDPTIDEVANLATRLMALIDTKHVAVTLAHQGVFLLERTGVSEHIPAYPVDRPHDVGAGDSFTSAVALSMTAGATFSDAARTGLLCARIAVGKRRTAVVRHQELLQAASLIGRPETTELHDLASLSRRSRLQGKTVVFTNGVFDILHAGHVNYLRAAKQLGDVLVVGVNSDESARRLKGRNRPINGEGDRMALVEALDSVDHVVLFDEDDPSNVIRALRPAIHVKGGDYEDQNLPEAAAVSEVGGRIEIVPLAGDLSTSALIDRIIRLDRVDLPTKDVVA